MKKGKTKVEKKNWWESYTNLVLGAIIVVILGLLVANFLTKRNQEIGDGQQTTQAEQTATVEESYKVKEGDSLSQISENFYGSQDFWPVLANSNNIQNPNIIFVDSTLKLPSKDQAEKVKTQMSQTSYDVGEGDTLFIIAEKMYGDGSKWSILDRANNVGRLPNGNPLIFTGSKLIVPR